MSDVEFHIDRDELAAEVSAQINAEITAGEYDAQLQGFMENEVIPVWRQNSPEDSGAYKESVEVKKPASGGAGKVGTSIGYAHILEYGSVDTPEFSPRGRTEAYFENHPESL